MSSGGASRDSLVLSSPEVEKSISRTARSSEAVTRKSRFSPGETESAVAPSVPSSGLSFRVVGYYFDTDLILQALEQTHWNKNQAAKLLGLNRTTLIEKIKKKGLEPATPASN